MAESASSIPKDLRPLVKLARKQGWTFERTNGGHFCFTDPTGGRWIAPGTASDMRANGMTPFAVDLAVKEAYEAHVAANGARPPATSQHALRVWRASLTQAVVAALRGLR